MSYEGTKRNSEDKSSEVGAQDNPHNAPATLVWKVITDIENSSNQAVLIENMTAGGLVSMFGMTISDNGGTGIDILNNAGNVTISVTLTPSLRDSDNVHIYIDGNEMARGPFTSFHFQSMDRGSHEIHAEVKNKEGKSLIKSKPITFYLLRVAVGGAP